MPPLPPRASSTPLFCRAAAARAWPGSAATRRSSWTSPSTCTMFWKWTRTKRSGACRTRLRPRRPARRGGKAHAHVRPRPGHAHALHSRRHGRQQQLRHARADGGTHGGKHRGAGNPAVRRHAHDGRQNQSEEELERIIAEGGRKGEIYAQTESPARQVRGQNTRMLPRHSAPRVRVLPGKTAARTRLQRGAGARRHGSDLRDLSGNHGQTRSGVPRRVPSSSWAIPTFTAPPTM